MMRHRTWVGLCLAPLLFACSSEKEIPTGSVAGKATIQGAANSSGVIVTVGGLSAVTDAAGAYRLDGLPLRTYSVIATASGTVEGTLATTVTVGSGVVTAPDLTFSAVVLSGTASVVGIPNASGIQVSLDGAGTPTSTGADGAFSFTGVSAGFHSLTFTAAGGLSDVLPTLFFVPGSTPLVPDAATGAFFKMSPFELQVGRRAVSSTTLTSNSMIVSADGTAVAYVDSVDPGTGLGTLFTVPTGGGAPVKIATGVNTSIKLSDDGRFVAYVKDGELFVAQATGGTPVKVSSNGGINQFDFSPASVTNPTVYFTALDGSGVNSLFESSITLTGTSLSASGLYSLPSISSYTLKRLAKRIFYFQNATGSIVVGSRTAACKGATLLPADVVLYDPSSVSTLFFSADESLIAFESFTPTTAFKVMKADGTGMVTIDPGFFPFTGGTFSPDGKRVAYSNFSQLKSSDTTAPVPVLLGNGALSGSITFSPDSSQLAYVVDDTTAGAPTPLRKKLYLGAAAPPVPAPGVPATAQEMAVGVRGPVAFSPDGTRLLYAANATDGAPFNLFVRPLVGSAVQVASTVAPGTFTPVYQFSRNGQNALFQIQSSAGNVSLSMVPAGGGTVIPLSGSLATSTFPMLTESPDGTRLLIRENQSFSPSFSWGVRVANLATGTTQALVSRATIAQWGKAGTPAADKVVTLRTASIAPYTFQNGIYVSDVP